MDARGIAKEMGKYPVSPPRLDIDLDVPAGNVGRVGADDVGNVRVKRVGKWVSMDGAVVGEPIVDESVQIVGQDCFTGL